MKSHVRPQSLGELLGQAVNSRTVIVAITLILAWYLGQKPNVLYIGISIILAAGLIVARYPQIGILSLIPLSLVVPFAVGTGTQTQLPLSFIGIPVLWGIWFIGNIYYRRPISGLRSRVMLALLGMVTSVTIAFVSGYLPWNAFAALAPIRAQLGGWGLFAFSVGALALTGFQIDSAKWLKILVVVFLVIGTVFILGRVTELWILDLIIVPSATGSVLWIWLTVLPASQLIFNRGMAKRWQLFCLALIAATFYASFANPIARSWASGWLPAALSLILILALRWPKFSILAGVMGVVVVIIGFRFISDFFLAGENSYSLLTRTAAIEILLKIIEFDPWFGMGPSNYYYYTPLYPILGYYVSFNSHNQYIDIIAQTGIIGLFFYLWAFVELIYLGWKLRRRLQDKGFELGYVNACIAGAMGMLFAGALGDWVIPFVYNVGVTGFRASVIGWIFLGGLLSLNHIYPERSVTAEPVEAQSPQRPSLSTKTAAILN